MSILENDFGYLNNFYDVREEEARLASRHGRVEFLTTMRYVEKYLTPGAKIIEIGAGTGRYSRALADKGYKIEAVEPVASHIETFRYLITHGQDINITQANALDLSMFADNSFDITLLLGPLYHLFTDENKRTAISEALRVTKPEGVVFAAYCQSDASIANSGFLRRRFDIKEHIKRGLIDPVTFAASSCPEEVFEIVRKEDIDRVMTPFAVEPLHYVGTDMFTLWISDAFEEMDDETYSIYLQYHFSICERSDLVGASHHSLDVFRKM